METELFLGNFSLSVTLYSDSSIRSALFLCYSKVLYFLFLKEIQRLI